MNKEIENNLIAESRIETCEMLKEMGYHIRLDDKLSFWAQFERGGKYEELSEEELVEMLEEANNEYSKDFIDDSEL